MTSFELDEHLSDQQFVECLDRPPLRPELQRHLLTCGKCRLELKNFEKSIAEFDTAARDWSQSRPVASLRAKAEQTRTTWMFQPLRWALAALLLAGIAVPVYKSSESRDRRLNNDLAEHAEDSEAQIREDNTLLQSVNTAIGSTELSPIQEYGITLKPETRAPHHAPRIQ